MGCCCSLFTSTNNAVHDDELTPLLSEDNRITDEQDEVLLILNEFSNNLINIGSTESNDLPAHEVERLAKIYQERINNLEISIPNTSWCLLKDVSTAEAVDILSSEPISQEDERLIIHMMTNAVQALNMEIKETEELIVAFPSK